MIPPLAATAPPEPTTVPSPRAGDRFAGTLADALTDRARRDHRSPSAGPQEATATAVEGEASDDVDADATTGDDIEPAGQAEAAGVPDARATAVVAGSTAGITDMAVDAQPAAGLRAGAAEADAVPGVEIPAVSIGATADTSTPLTWAADAAVTERAGAVESTSFAEVVPIDAGSAGGRSARTTSPADTGAPNRPTETAPPDGSAAASGDVPDRASAPMPPAPDAGTAAVRHADAPRNGPVSLAGHAAATDDAGTPSEVRVPVQAGADGDRTGIDGPAATAPVVPPDAPAAAHALTSAPVATAPAPAPASGTPSHIGSPATAPQPNGSATVAASDTVRFLRELGPARAVQRLAVDLDGAMVSVRVDPTGAAPVRVQIVDDPAGRLDRSWLTSVERTLSHSMQRDGSGTNSGRHRRAPSPHPDDLAPTVAAGRRWADALGEAT